MKLCMKTEKKYGINDDAYQPAYNWYSVKLNEMDVAQLLVGV